MATRAVSWRSSPALRSGTTPAWRRRPSAGCWCAILPAGVADLLREDFRFYDWDPATREVRWMCAFDTTEADVDAFVAAIGSRLTA